MNARTWAVLIAALATGACVARAAPAAPAAAQGASPDVAFVRGMIAHHAQALEMTRLAPERAAGDELRVLARRIDASQTDEIALMTRWLEARGEAAAAPHGHAHGAAADTARMPGMLSPAELARLAAAQGPAFDRLFLELMIRHHEGALVMVERLLATPGGGEDPEVFQLLSGVDADQRAEIARMTKLLKSIPQ